MAAGAPWRVQACVGWPGGAESGYLTPRRQRLGRGESVREFSLALNRVTTLSGCSYLPEPAETAPAPAAGRPREARCPPRAGGPSRSAVPAASGARRRRRLLSLALVAAMLLTTVISGLIYLRPPSQSLVVASVPYWNLDYGTATVLANPRTFSEMSPWMYGLDSSGQIVPQYAAGAGRRGRGAARAAAGGHGSRWYPRMANIVARATGSTGRFITGILHNPRLRARHVAAIVALVQRQGYAGIDIDYEDLRASDKERLHRLHHPARRRAARQRQDLVGRPVREDGQPAATASATSRRTTTPSARWPTRCG